jgi:hypothetical protein
MCVIQRARPLRCAREGVASSKLRACVAAFLEEQSIQGEVALAEERPRGGQSPAIVAELLQVTARAGRLWNGSLV